MSTKIYKCICGREFLKSPSYAAHVSHCQLQRELKGKGNEKRKGFHTIKKDITCVCGKTFHTNASYVGHTCNCKVYLGEERYNKNKAIHANSITTFNKECSYDEWHKIHDEGLKKQSQTRKEKYASGELKPACGVGHGKYSYIIFNNEKIMLRSTYEYIFALWLFFNNKPINVEKIRVPASQANRYSNTFISDFNVDNVIYELKGIPSGKDKYIRESFEKAGYIFNILYNKDIEDIVEELQNKFNYDVQDDLEKIRIGHNSKNYFVKNLDILAKAFI